MFTKRPAKLRVKLFAEVATVEVTNDKASWTNDIAALNIVRAELWDGPKFVGTARIDLLPRVFIPGETLALDVSFEEENSFVP